METKIIPTNRIIMVDALRDFALMGLLLVHSVEMFELYWSNPGNSPLTEFVFAIFMGKSFSLLAVCFGFSFYIIMENANKRGEDFSLGFAWRLFILGLIGLLHGLLYRGDILQILAITGLAIIPLNRIKSNKLLLFIALTLLSQPFLLFQLYSAIKGQEWANQLPSYYNDGAMETYLTGNFIETLRINVWEGAKMRWGYILETGEHLQLVALFIFGLLIGRIGFFERPNDFKSERRIVLFGLIIFWLVLNFFGPIVSQTIPSTDKITRARAIFDQITGGIFNITQMLIMAIVFIEIYLGFGRKTLDYFASAGRMTLTFYLAQSIFLLPIYYHFGLDGIHWIKPWQCLAIGISFFFLQVIFANWWFKHFQYGPVEWFWRACTYRTLNIPFKIKKSA